MSEKLPGEITQLLQRFRQGDAEALSQLLPMIYEELRKVARQCVSSQHASWQPTALAHELFIHLLEGETYDWKDSEHFFATASLKMRHLLIDEARRKHAVKHGGGFGHVALNEALPSSITTARLDEILSVHEALKELEKDEVRVVTVINLRFFLGLSEEETASVLHLSTRQVRRDWAYAKGWLALRLQATPLAA